MEQAQQQEKEEAKALASNKSKKSFLKTTTTLANAGAEGQEPVDGNLDSLEGEVNLI